MLILSGFPRGLGYLQIDHRAGENAPNGLPLNFESDTYTCSHCQRVVIMNMDRTRERYKCSGCTHHICDDCAAERVAAGGHGPCVTWNQKLEIDAEAEARQPQHPTLILP